MRSVGRLSSFLWLELCWFLLTLCDGQEVNTSPTAATTSTTTTAPSNAATTEAGGRGGGGGGSGGNTTTEASRFLKHGDTYKGRVATTVIELVDASVAVLITMDNWSKWALVDPLLTMECGGLVENPSRNDSGLPDIVKPGYSEMVLFEKSAGLSGVCGVLAYTLEVPLDEDPDFLQIMFSVPYNLNTYNAYFAVGVSEIYMNNSDVFDDLYYYSGPFQREKAGNMVQFSSERVLVRATLTPDTYKPILSLVVLPLDKEDQFVPGEYYSPRLRGGAATATATATGTALSILAGTLRLAFTPHF